MSNVVIRVEDLSKQYRLGLVGSGTLQDDFTRWWATIRGKDDPFLKIGESNDRSVKGQSDYVWSLKDINFDVQQGEVLGIIGRNGAGKSTLLKILSKVTAPTTGSVKIKGRIASLLEVGTGFHPELTGRENIFLNGAILGMKRLEITQKLEEIIAFSGVERYIDTPVKRYSSGMYVRLAFAVAAHLESEILIIDEVLAVGDAEFQKKCLGKMKDVSQGEGRTVLFVSHNMGTITQLCQNAIILEQGAILAKGGASEVISKHYLNKEITENYEYINTSSKDLFIKRAYSHNVNKNNKSSFFSNEEIFFSITITQKKNQKNLTTSIALLDKFGNRVFTSLKEINDEIQKTENYQVTIKIPSNIIAPNLYSFHFALYYPKGEVYDQINYECPIKVIDAGTNFILYEGLDYGSVIIDCETSITI